MPFYIVVSVNKRYDSFQFFAVKLIGELFLVFVVNRVGTRYEVAATEPEEQQSGSRPSEYSKAEPFGNLTEIVGTGNIFVKTFLG